jgi:CheY-like chemotaxis protein
VVSGTQRNERHPATAPTILIVDDDPSIRQTLTSILDLRGYPAVAVADGAQALTYLDTPGASVSLVLLDLQMPVLDGFGFLAAKRRNPKLMGIPVVIYSGCIDEDEIPPGIPHFRKGTCSMAELVVAIDRACRKRARG